jgi:hypothetical protein
MPSPASRDSQGTPHDPSLPLPTALDEKLSSGSADKFKPNAENLKYMADDTMLIKATPVIQSGADVSNFVVDDRDDGDSALTFRAFFLGTVIAGLGAALARVDLTMVYY